jgi:hypothetical protein
VRGAFNVCKSLPGGDVGLRALGGVGSVPDFEYPFPDFAWLPLMCEVGLRLLRPQNAILHSRAAARYPIFRSVEQFSGTVQIWRCTIFLRSTVQCRNRSF